MNTPALDRRRCLIALGAMGASSVGLLAGCAGLGGPTVITLGERELAGLIERAFPLQRRVLELVDVQLSAPRLTLLPELNRLSVAMALRTQERLLGRAARARLGFDCALRYEPQDASLRLTQVRVQQLTLDSDAAPDGRVATAAPSGPPTGSPAAAHDGLNGSLGGGQRLAQALAERVLEDLSVYRLPAERLASLRQLGLQPGAVTVTARGVEITLARSRG